MSPFVKTVLLWVVMIVIVFFVWSLFQTTKGTSEAINYTTFLERVDAGAVQSVYVRGNEINGYTKPDAPGGRYSFHVLIPPNYPYTFDALRTHGVVIEVQAEHDSPFVTALVSWAPILFLIALWMYFMRGIRRHYAEKQQPQAPQP